MDFPVFGYKHAECHRVLTRAALLTPPPPPRRFVLPKRRCHGRAGAEEERDLLRLQLNLVTAERDALVGQMPKLEPHPGWTAGNVATAADAASPEPASGPPWEAAAAV